MEKKEKEEIFTLRDGEEITQKELQKRYNSLTSESAKATLDISIIKLEVR